VKKDFNKAGVDAQRTNQQNKKKIIELSQAGLSIPEELTVLIRDPTKELMEVELDALLPNPSLQQAIIIIELEQIKSDIPIDPQLLKK
jgi:hypothetical protein